MALDYEDNRFIFVCDDCKCLFSDEGVHILKPRKCKRCFKGD